MTNLFQRLFCSGYYFTVALRRRTEENVLETGRFRAECVIPANRKNWCADPMLAEEDGRTYLFYEAVSQDLGRIDVREVFSDLTMSEPTTVLSGPRHFSYPFVFRKDGCWYMIPESSAEERVRLYRAAAFPYEWEAVTDLLTGSYVDTTVFPWEGRWILLTFETDHRTEAVTPKAFEWIDDGARSVLKPLKWDGWDGLSVRGAGPVFLDHGQPYRPAQKNREQIYGDSLVFHRFSLEADRCCEEPAGALRIEHVDGAPRLADGLHTYCASASFEAIDLRCRDFILWKIPGKLLRRVFRKRR